MKSSVITFPGSNCDRDMDVALKKFGFKNKMVWHADAELPKSDLVVLPGGFSYGDYLRCGSMASKSKIMQSVINFANSGGMVMGICNGFQILVETGLVPGVLLRNKYLEFICKNVFVKINRSDFFKKIISKGSIGMAEAYMNNEFETDNLSKLIELTAKNIEIIHKFSGILDLSFINYLKNIFNKNTKSNSKKNNAI